MFPVSIYTGGSVENGPMGATYNKPPSASFPADDDIVFDQLKAKIFQLTGISEDKYTINVNARWNAGTGGSHCFVLLPICENSMWRMLVDKTLSGASGWSIVELFVDQVPNSGLEPREKSQSNVDFAETPEHPARISFHREKSPEEAPDGEDGESQELTDEESFELKPRDESGLYAGRLFDTLDDLKRAVKEYHIRENRKVITGNSNHKMYVVRCDVSACKWRLYATKCKDSNCFQIKTFNGKHVCSSIGDGKDHRNMSCEFISHVILDLIKRKRNASPKEIQAFVHKQYPCTPSYSKAWKAKELAIAHLFGEWKESYTKLAPFLNAIQVTNPGTKVEWWSDGTADPNARLFKGVAWAFAPAIEAFKSCRPVISIASTILCGKYSGRMLLAVAYDADGQVIPLAFAVIHVENDDDSWSWFMRWLRTEVVGSRPLCVISDRQDSLLRLFDQSDSGWCTGTGQAFHRYCSRYLCESIRSAYKKDELVKLVKWVSRQNQPSKFRQGMVRIMETNREAYNWLVKLGTRSGEESAYHLWALCQDGGYRYGIMAANGNECVFNIFPKIQELPITALVELTFTKSAELFAGKKDAASKIDLEKQLWSNKVAATLEARRAKASQHQIISFQHRSVLHDEVMVETRSKAKHTIRVGTDQKNCSCQKPQLTGIPCSHLLAVCAFRSINFNHLVDSAYDARQLLSTWTLQFHRPGGPEEWPDYTGVAYSPDCKSVKRGKRKLVNPTTVPAKLKKSASSDYRCSLCRQSGHRRERCSKNQATPGLALTVADRVVAVDHVES